MYPCKFRIIRAASNHANSVANSIASTNGDAAAAAARADEDVDAAEDDAEALAGHLNLIEGGGDREEAGLTSGECYSSGSLAQQQETEEQRLTKAGKDYGMTADLQVEGGGYMQVLLPVAQ